MLDEDERITVDEHLSEVALFRPDLCQSGKPCAEIIRILERQRIYLHLSIGSGGDDLIEGSFAQCRTNRIDQVDGELTVPVGECSRCRSGQLPVNRRAPSTGGLGHGPSDEAGFFERVEVLPQGRVGESELAREIGRSRRLDALQPFNDSSLGVGQVGHPDDSSGVTTYFGSFALHNPACPNARYCDAL